MNRQLQPSTTYGAVLGGVLTFRRKELELGQADVAKRLGITQASWSRIESGATPLTVDMLARSAAALQTTPTAISQQADLVMRQLNKQGISVEHGTTKNAVQEGAALIAAVVLFALVMTVLKPK